MIQKIKQYLETHDKQYELIRYIIAGGLTTLLSFVIFSLFCILVSGNHTVDGATPDQATAGQVVAWIISVIFAFWINRRMVFQRSGGSLTILAKEFGQFVLSRLFSGVVFEIGLFRLLAHFGVGNVVNKLIVLVLVTVFNYVVSKFWIFAKGPKAAQGPEAPQAPAGETTLKPEGAGEP